MPHPDLTPATPPEHAPARAGLWSALVALVGVLAVLLGVQASRFEPMRGLTASAHTVPLPELRPATPTLEPTPGTPPVLPPAPALRVTWRPSTAPLARAPELDAPRPSLALLGRRQGEGG